MHGARPGDGVSRDLTPNERDLLAAALSVEGLDASDALRSQAATARASSSCGCGCGSIYLIVDRDASERVESLEEGVIVEGVVIDEAGQPVGGLLLFQDDGWLNNLEVYSTGDTPLALPRPALAHFKAYRS